MASEIPQKPDGTNTAVGDPPSEAISRFLTLDTIAKVVTIGIVPAAIGALHRVIAFALSGQVPVSVAVDLSAPKLGLLGLGLVVPGIILALAFALYFRLPARVPKPRIPTRVRARLVRWLSPHWAKARPHLKRALARPWVALAFAVIVTGIVLGFVFWYAIPTAWSLLTEANGPGSLLTVIVSGVLIPYGFALSLGPTAVPFRRFVIPAAAIIVVVAVSSSIGPTTAGTFVATLEFTNEAGMRNGTFSVLGEVDDATWLLRCSDPTARVTRIPTSSILTVRVAPFGPMPSVPTVAESERTGLWVAGFQQGCPSR